MFCSCAGIICLARNLTIPWQVCHLLFGPFLVSFPCQVGLVGVAVAFTVATFGGAVTAEVKTRHRMGSTTKTSEDSACGGHEVDVIAISV